MSEPAPKAPVPADPLVTHPLIDGRYTGAELGESLLRPVLGPPGRGWWALVGLCSALTVLLLAALVLTGLGCVGLAWRARRRTKSPAIS